MGEALADDALQHLVGTLFVAHVLGRVAEVELGKVAVQVSGAPVVIGPDHAVLEDGEKFSMVSLWLPLPRLNSRFERNVVSTAQNADRPRPI